MKKACISFGLILIIVLSAVLLTESADKTEYLRIHIRANSNSQIDQNIKYEVKDLVVSYLTPIIENAKSKDEAISIIESQKSAVNGLIDRFLSENGFSYEAKTEVRKEKFPTRAYGELVLEEGVYDAVIIELGSGNGDNWWCVVFPPLCFTEDRVTYYSVIAEFFKRLKQGG